MRKFGGGAAAWHLRLESIEGGQDRLRLRGKTMNDLQRVVGSDQHDSILGPQATLKEGSHGGDDVTQLAGLEMSVIDVEN